MEKQMMKRREFLVKTGLVAAGIITNGACTATKKGMLFRWTRKSDSRLYSTAAYRGQSIIHSQFPGLFDAFCRLASESPDQATRLGVKQPVAKHGPLRAELRHQLCNSGSSAGEDLLEATLTVRNTSDIAQQVVLGFASSVQPSTDIENHRVYLPLSAASLYHDRRFKALGVTNFLQDCDQKLGDSELAAHYFEPMASFPTERHTQALLLSPVLDMYHPKVALRIAIFTPSDEPMRFTLATKQPLRASRCVTIQPGATHTQRGWLMLHKGDAAVAWRAFHRFAHREELSVPSWVREFKVHYYDFLSSAQGRNGQRGDGYEAAIAHFAEFRVGMATQHGYYPAIGDYINPNRKIWQAMRGDKHGAADMSLEKMQARIKATRASGAKAAIYLHAAILDDASECFAQLRDGVQIDAKGQRMKYTWNGPDTAGKNWRMSLAAQPWCEHLLQQAGWIMDILQPDAIVMDETFVGIGYDHHPDRRVAISAGAIDFYRKMRSVIHSFGNDKAFLTSDCSMSPFVLWADGECGDHAYPLLLGHRLYTQEPVRYLAALGDKPWRPCAWHFQRMWPAQMKLARQVNSGVGVSNGWLEFTGLGSLPADVKSKMIADIATLF